MSMACTLAMWLHLSAHERNIYAINATRKQQFASTTHRQYMRQNFEMCAVRVHADIAMKTCRYNCNIIAICG